MIKATQSVGLRASGRPSGEGAAVGFSLYSGGSRHGAKVRVWCWCGAGVGHVLLCGCVVVCVLCFVGWWDVVFGGRP